MKINMINQIKVVKILQHSFLFRSFPPNYFFSYYSFISCEPWAMVQNILKPCKKGQDIQEAIIKQGLY